MMRLNHKFLGRSAVRFKHLLLFTVKCTDVPPMPSLERLVLQHVPNDLACESVRALL